MGYANYSAVVMVGVLITNTVLRPLAYKLHPSVPLIAPEEINYHLEFICRTADESRMRALLLQTVSRFPLTLYALRSEDRPRGVLVDADVRLLGRNDELLEQIVARLCLEDGVSSISWHLLPPSGEHPNQSEFIPAEDT